MGLGRVKTQACCGAVEWRSQTQMFFPSRARLTSLRPVTQRRRNLENSAVPTFLARATHVLPACYYVRAEGVLEACWNRILTVFDPYTFLHSQGHFHPCVYVSFRGEAVVRSTDYGRFVPLAATRRNG